MRNAISPDDLLATIPPVMRFIRASVKRLSEEEMTYPHFRIISFLYDASPTNRQLAETIGVSGAAMSRMLDGLVRRGLLTRGHHRGGDGGDRRLVRLELTAAGKEAYLRVRGHIRRDLQSKMDRLGPSQQTALSSGLGVLKELFS